MSDTRNNVAATVFCGDTSGARAVWPAMTRWPGRWLPDTTNNSRRSSTVEKPS